VLVVPRRHVETIFELDDSLAARLSQTVVKVARAVRTAIGAPGLNVWQSNGEAAFQEVPHVHFHLFPRYPADGMIRVYRQHPEPESRSQLDALARRIRQVID